VSLVIDAGTIHHRRFLDLVLLTAGCRIPPFLYDGVERTRDCLNDHREIVGNAIIDLRPSGVKMKFIVGENLHVQAMALAHWSPKSLLQKLEPECRTVVQVTNSHCRVHVVTRWFSRDGSFSW
jgi:hypothetical protein